MVGERLTGDDIGEEMGFLGIVGRLSWMMEELEMIRMGRSMEELNEVVAIEPNDEGVEVVANRASYDGGLVWCVESRNFSYRLEMSCYASIPFVTSCRVFSLSSRITMDRYRSSGRGIVEIE